MRQGNSKTMTQEKHLDSGHRANKPVNDQCNGDDASTSGQRSSKNSRKKNSQPPTKMQQADRKTRQQSNKSAIGKASTSSKAKVPSLANRECSSRDKIGPSQRSTVGNQSDRVGAAVDDKTSATDTDMTIITQQNNTSLRDSIPSDVVDSTKNVSDTGDRATQRAGVDDSIDFRASDKNATANNTDLQDDGATSGIGPTNENNNFLTAKTDTAEDHPQCSDETKDASITDDIGKGLEACGSPSMEKSRVKPLPKTDDPIARLNALRANISNALREVKTVLDQHTPKQSLFTEDKANEAGDDGTVQFRFVRRIRKKSVIKFDEEEIICNVVPAPSTEESKLTSGKDSTATNQTVDNKDDLTRARGKRFDSSTVQSSHIDSPTPEKSINKNESAQEIASSETATKELILSEEKPEINVLSNKTQNAITNDLEGSESEKPLEVMVLGQHLNSQKVAKTVKPAHKDSLLKKELQDRLLVETIGKADNIQKKQSSIEKSESDKANRESVQQQKDVNLKSIKSSVDSKIPVAKKPISTINNKPKDLSKMTTELVISSKKNEEQSEEITGGISNSQVIVKESEGKKMTDEKLEQKAPENLLKDINERRVQQTQNTKAGSNEDLNSVTKLDNIENVKQVIKNDKQSIETSSNQKQRLVKKPLQKFSNVEAVAKEILNQAAKNKLSKPAASGISNKEISKKIPDIAAYSNQHSVDNEVQNETSIKKNKESSESNQQYCKAATENRVAVKPDETIEESLIPSKVTLTTEKDILTKPPVKLKTKRGSLTESSKLTPKVKTVQPKRASIGSETELIQKVKQDQLKEALKDNIFIDSIPLAFNEQSKAAKTSASSILKPSSDSAAANKVLNSTAPIKAAKTITSNCAQSETPAKNNTTMKVSPSSLIESKSESLAEITQTPLTAVNTTITQPIPIESNDAKIATELSQNVLDIGKPLTSSPDKLVSSESAGLSRKNSATGSASTMTVVKKDIVPSITPKQSLDELNDKVKSSESIKDAFDDNLVEFTKISTEQPEQLKAIVRTNCGPRPTKVELPIVQNCEVIISDVPNDSPVLISTSDSKDQHVDSLNDSHPQSQQSILAPENGLPPHGRTSPAKKEVPQRAKLRKLQKKISISEDTQEKGLEVTGQSSTSEDDSAKEGPKILLGDAKAISEKQDNDLPATIEPTPTSSASTDVPMTEETPKEVKASELLTSTATESSLSEGEKDGSKAPATKKMRKMKKVVIRRIKRRLSKEGSLDEKAEPEVCEKPIAEPPVEETPEAPAAEKEPVEEEPPVPKVPKSCLVKRSYYPGQMVMYADRVRKTVKWKKAVVLDKITDISYKLVFDGQEKPAHISYIKKCTDKKVQFGGKEYLEIDYQQEYESSSEEEVYNIWARV